MSVITRLDTREMDRIIKDSGKKTTQIVNHLAFKVEGISKMLAPFKYGALRNSGFTEPASGSRKYAVVGYKVEYAPFQEFGTKRMAAHPFLTPALEQVSQEFNDGRTWEEVVK